MHTTIVIPWRLYEEARRRGIDVESRIVELLARELELDPGEEAELHLELAERYFEEAEGLIERGEVVQASEKLYKVAKECVKAMAEALGLKEAVEARRRGRWTLKLLDAAARRLAEKEDPRVYDDWDHAYLLHVEGFHEARLSLEQVRARAEYVKELLETARRVVRGASGAERSPVEGGAPRPRRPS